MPSALKYIPPTDIDRDIFGVEVTNERQTRRDAYRVAIAYYEGTHPDQLEVPDDTPDDNVIVNLVKMTADRTISFLFPEVPTFEIDPTTVDPTDEEKFITEFFDANGGLSTLTKMALRGFLSGHVYIRVKPAIKSRRKLDMPKLLVLDPNYVGVYWRADDVGDVLWYELRYSVGDTIVIQDFVKNERDDNWVIITYEAQTSDKKLNGVADRPDLHGVPGGVTSANELALDFLTFRNTHFERTAVAIHSSIIPPIIDFPHLPNPDSYFGVSEANQKSMQDTINRIAGEMNKIVRENADPVDVILGADLDDIQDEGGIISIGALGAKIQRLEMKADMSGIKDMFEKLVETYLAVARVVLLKGEAKDLQRVTNASVRTLFLDALSKNSILRSSYGHGLRKVAKVALIMGYEAGLVPTNPEELDIEINFGEPLPTDMSEVSNINAIQVNMGARSLRTAATKMGDNWAFEQDAMSTEQEVAMEQQREQLELQKEFTPDDPPDDKPLT